MTRTGVDIAGTTDPPGSVSGENVATGRFRRLRGPMQTRAHVR